MGAFWCGIGKNGAFMGTVPTCRSLWMCAEPWLWLPGRRQRGDAPHRDFRVLLLVVQRGAVLEITSPCPFFFPPPAAWPRWRACCPGAWGSAPCSAPASRRPTGCWWPPKSTPCPPTSAGPLPTWHPQRTDPARRRWRRAAGHRGSPAPGTISSAPGSKYVRKLLVRGRGRKIRFFFFP